MVKLSKLEKQVINAGAASVMGIATGVATTFSILNLIVDIVNRYWPSKSYENYSFHSSCSSKNLDCLENKLSNFEFSLPVENRITIFDKDLKV